MKKAKIYIPSKTAMQSGRGKSKKWLLEFEVTDSDVSPLMGWISSKDIYEELKLEFNSKEKAIEYTHWQIIELSIALKRS